MNTLISVLLLGVLHLMFGEGAWLVFLLIIAGALTCFYFARRSHNSPYIETDTKGNRYPIADKTPYKVLPAFWGGWFLVLCLIVALIHAYAEA
jgi:hypothetical protein